MDPNTFRLPTTYFQYCTKTYNTGDSQRQIWIYIKFYYYYQGAENEQ